MLARIFAGSESPSPTDHQPDQSDVLYQCCVTTFAVYTPENAGFIHAQYPDGLADKPMQLYLGRVNKLYIDYILGISTLRMPTIHRVMMDHKRCPREEVALSYVGQKMRPTHTLGQGQTQLRRTE